MVNEDNLERLEPSGQQIEYSKPRLSSLSLNSGSIASTVHVLGQIISWCLCFLICEIRIMIK